MGKTRVLLPFKKENCKVCKAECCKFGRACNTQSNDNQGKKHFFPPNISILIYTETGGMHKTKASAEGESPLQVFRLLLQEFFLMGKGLFKKPVRIAKQASSHCDEICRFALQHILS